ncbi:mucin-1-like [Ranitomeya imitator]|uniref:mucin-1-like n=1 Tax=Ranitomeya imitator TaxID=111125 RepID=UPI001AA9B276
MGGRWESRLLLGLLCLLSGALLLPGEAQEDTSLLPTDSSVATSGPFLLSSADLGTGSSVPPGLSDASSELPDNGIITETGRPSPPPPFTVGGPESEGAGSSVSTAPGEATSSPVTSDPSSVAPVTKRSETTSMEATQPPPISTGNNVTDDPATETSSLLATLRTTATKMAPSDDATPHATPSISSYSTWMSTITTSLFITTTVTSPEPAPTTSAPHTTRAEVQKGPSVLEVGDEKDLTSYHSRSSSNPLFVMIVSVFTIMVLMVVVVVGFHRYKKRNSRTEFRRLQDLPMDDMMEDTPLSLYSY